MDGPTVEIERKLEEEYSFSFKKGKREMKQKLLRGGQPWEEVSQGQGEDEARFSFHI